jgi:hypothetical protein
MSDELRPGEIVHTDQHYPAIVLVVHGDPRQKVNLLVTRDDDEEHPVWVHTYVPHSQPGQDHTWHRVIDCTPTITTKAPDPLPFNEETWGLRRTIGLQDARIHELEQALIDFSRNGLATSVRPANSDLWSPVLWHQYLERISDTVKRKASYALDDPGPSHRRPLTGLPRPLRTVSRVCGRPCQASRHTAMKTTLDARTPPSTASVQRSRWSTNGEM